MKTKLNNRQGKMLRFVANKTDPVKPEQTINSIAWSDLPHTILQAVMAFKKLLSEGYVEQVDGGYLATDAGRKHLAAGDAAGLWHARGMPPMGLSSRKHRAD